MTVQALIDECRQSGVAIRLIDGALKLKGDPDAVKIAANRLRPHKADLLQYLIDRAANDVSNLVREFMAVDGVPETEAEALATVSIQLRSVEEWLALIAELDELITRYCIDYKVSDECQAAILAARSGQSLASIPATLEWFRRACTDRRRQNPPRPQET